MKIYTFKNINDASIKIKNEIVNIVNNNGYYIFKDGIILNICLMSYSNTGADKPFIQVRYDNSNNSYEIRIQCIIYSDSSGYNFYNNGNKGSIIIYYI